MIVGDPKLFALESGISKAYTGPGPCALGFFRIHLGGASFGVRAANATMLSSSFDEVGRRLQDRGRHVAPFAREADAGRIAWAVRRALYFDVPPEETFFGMSQQQFAAHVYEKDLLWAPDGDEAFDDGSYVLHLDQEEQARLIGFRSHQHDPYDQGTLREVTMPTETFYGVLKGWATALAAEWLAMPKEPYPVPE